MKVDSVDGQTLNEMFISGTIWLEKSAPDINAINVFPVPDGDTGTNMLLTMRSAIEEVATNSHRDASSVVKSMAYGSLMGARGNSGVILSQFWRGLSNGLEGKNSFDGRDFARALAEASRLAYEGIIHPVEGTILTVLKDAAEAADKAAQDNPDSLVWVLEAAVEAAKDSVARTPSLLPVLREAGVVDAGGQGLYVLLDGALHFLKGEADEIKYQTPSMVATEFALAPKASQAATELEVPYGYCTNFVLEGQKLDLEKIKKHLKKKGQSLIVTGDDSLARVHIHTFELGEVINYATHLGKLHEIVINNMDDQYVEFVKMQKERLPAVEIAIIPVVSGDGLFEAFKSLGATIIVPGGQTMNPSVRELAQAVEFAPTDNVLLLPNNKNIILTASQIQSLTSKRVKVIPTRTIPQGIAAFLAFNYEMNLEQNARNMEQAATTVKTIEITKAVRKTEINGLKIKKGQFIAILDDENLIASGDIMLDVTFQALIKADIESAEVITIYYGAETQASEAENMAQRIRDGYRLDVEIVRGGQPFYNYIISLE